jgi:hypothetical protein
MSIGGSVNPADCRLARYVLRDPINEGNSGGGGVGREESRDRDTWSEESEGVVVGS